MLRTEKTQDLEAFSECSSGCQSGWTLYLCHSQNTSPIKDISAREDEEDDLSMLSDASSGPTNIRQDDYFNVCYSSNDGDDFPTSFSQNRAKKKRRIEKELMNQKQNREAEHNFFLEDTASCSPPPLCFSKNTSSVSSRKKLTMEDDLELSGGFSANQFEVCGQEGGKNQP